MNTVVDRSAAEERFRAVFAHLDDVIAYAKRRGSSEPEEIGAETMAIAWRKLSEIPQDDARPWLFTTARLLVFSQWRRTKRHHSMDPHEIEISHLPEMMDHQIDPEIQRALETLSMPEREALLLVAWEDLTPAMAAQSLGISKIAFRVRLHRARSRFQAAFSHQKDKRSTTDTLITNFLEAERA